MKALHILYILLIAVAPFCAGAQSVIIKKDSSIIYCTIVKEDSASLVYKVKRKPTATIKQADVLGYYTAVRFAGKTKQVNKIASKLLVPDPGYDTLQLKKGDTITLNAFGELEFRHGFLSMEQAMLVMRNDTAGLKKLKKAIALRQTSLVVLSLATCAVVVVFKSPLNSDALLIAFGGITAGLVAVDIPLQAGYRKNLKTAVQLFNARHR